MDIERACKSVLFLFENDMLPISNYGAGIEQLAMKKLWKIADAISKQVCYRV